MCIADVTPSDGTDAPASSERFYYDAEWRLLEVRGDDAVGSSSWPATMSGAAGVSSDWWSDVVALPFEWRLSTQRVWDPIGVDRLVQRRVATTDDPLVELPDDFDELYWTVTERGGDVVEEVPEHSGTLFLARRDRFAYSSYGVPSRTPLGDFNNDDLINSDDLTLFASVMTLDHTSPAYLHTADYDLDGHISAKGDYAAHAAELGTGGFKGDYSTSGLIVGYAGSIWDPAVELWLMRHRWLDPHSGRWLTRDPAGYVDGMSLYGYVGQGVWAKVDPFGLWGTPKSLWGLFIDSGEAAIQEVRDDLDDLIYTAIRVQAAGKGEFGFYSPGAIGAAFTGEVAILVLDGAEGTLFLVDQAVSVQNPRLHDRSIAHQLTDEIIEHGAKRVFIAISVRSGISAAEFADKLAEGDLDAWGDFFKGISAVSGAGAGSISMLRSLKSARYLDDITDHLETCTSKPRSNKLDDAAEK